MPYLIAPLTDAGRQAAGYAYISSLADRTSRIRYAIAVRDKLAFIQDAFVRDVNGTRVAQRGRSQQRRPAGAGGPPAGRRRQGHGRGQGRRRSPSVTIQIAPLHPIQTPLRRDAPRRHDSAAECSREPRKPRCEPPKTRDFASQHAVASRLGFWHISAALEAVGPSPEPAMGIGAPFRAGQGTPPTHMSITREHHELRA